MKEIKPIIINGVDVSGCDELIETKRNIYCGIANSTRYNKCSYNPNCYCKQLKRKEQECLTLINKNNRLEEKYNAIEMLLDGKNTQYNQLKQECEKYKKCINDIKIINKDLLHDLCDNCGWYNTDGCDPDEDCVCESLIKIKRIINEVENER